TGLRMRYSRSPFLLPHFTLKYLASSGIPPRQTIYNTSIPRAPRAVPFFSRSVLKMSENTQNAGLGNFLKDGLTVAVFIGLLLTLQAAVMTEQAQLSQAAASAT